MPDLSNKVAVVTGASRGVGRGIAIELGAAGAKVYVTGRSVAGKKTTDGLPGTVDETSADVDKAGGEGIAVRCDHTVDKDVESLFARIKKEQGRLDLLVNNVWGGYEQYDGKDFSAPFWDQPLDYWNRMFTSGVRAHYTASRLAAPLMIKQRSGLIINISAGYKDKYLGNLMYFLAKGAKDRMVFGMADELKKYNIAAISLYPGFTRTERVMSVATPEMLEESSTESPHYSGRAVVALATDPNVMKKSGGTFMVGELAREYDFTDIDGTQPPPFVI